MRGVEALGFRLGNKNNKIREIQNWGSGVQVPGPLEVREALCSTEEKGS